MINLIGSGLFASVLWVAMLREARDMDWPWWYRGLVSPLMAIAVSVFWIQTLIAVAVICLYLFLTDIMDEMGYLRKRPKHVLFKSGDKPTPLTLMETDNEDDDEPNPIRHPKHGWPNLLGEIHQEGRN